MQQERQSSIEARRAPDTSLEPSPKRCTANKKMTNTEICLAMRNQPTADLFLVLRAATERRPDELGAADEYQVTHPSKLRHDGSKP